MASRKHIWAFIIVFLLPLVPVILLYFFFEDQNYFELKDKAKGLVALGPIGVYIFLLYPAWKIFVGTIDKSKEGRIKDIIGKWRIISKSKKGTTYEGEVTISASEDHVLDIAGVVRHDTDVVGSAPYYSDN